jgi:hypothetical protein
VAGNAVDLVKDLAGLDGRQRLADGAVGWGRAAATAGHH